MKLTGIIEDVFRGVTIFRGYATLKTLARLSASTSYQRDKDPDRIDAIKDYISNSSYVFYPELILGWQLDNPDAIRIIKEEENTSSVSLNNGIKIKKAKFKFKSLPLGEEPKTKVVTIEIPDSINETIFNRIDGNHRLSVVDKIKDETGIYDSEICNQIVPFSLIIQNKSNDANKFESAYFYLINSKAKALTTEENLKAIFKADHFTKSEKKELLSIETDTVIEAIGKCAEELAQRNLHIVNNIFDGCVYSLSYDICREFENPNIDAITSSISYIDDSKCPILVLSNKIWEILKDADALDRSRLPGKGCNPSFLRNHIFTSEKGKELLSLASQLPSLTEGCSWNSPVEELCNILDLLIIH